MRALSVFFKDIKSGVKKPMTLISFIAVIFVPILYCGMYLSAFWDPYGHLDELPVAVVNQDKGAQYEGKSLHIGSDLVDELKKNEDFKWNFVTEKEAQQGIDENRYYMKITIPENFSSQATTLMNDHPQPADLIYEPNGNYNFVAGQIGNSAVKDLKAKISAKVTEAYTNSLFDKVSEISSGLTEAGNGAGDIHTGAGKLQDGAAKLKENLNKLVSGTSELEAGMVPLANGAGKLQSGASELNKGASSLANGLDQLSAAHKQLQNGIEQAVAGASQLSGGLESSLEGNKKLNQGLHASLEGTTKLQQGLHAAVDGSTKLNQGLQSSADGSAKVAEGAKGVAQGLDQLVKANPALGKDPSVQKLLAASQAVAQGSEQVAAGQKQLAGGSEQLAAGSKQLSDGSDQLAEGNKQLVSGSDALLAGNQKLVEGASKLQAAGPKLTVGMQQFGSKLSEAAAGGHKLASGAQQLSTGTSSLVDGIHKLGGGVSTIASGSVKLDEGAGELKNGMGDLVSGSGKLADKLNEAADKTSDVKGTDERVTMYAQPVEVSENTSKKISNYGTGIAPYFLSISLFVGALLSTIIISMRGTTVEDASGLQRFFSRTFTFLLMSLFQSIVVATLVLVLVGLKVQSLPLFYLFTFATSFAFMMIIQAIVTWLDQPGRFLAVILMVLQLTTSAGTFPLELLPEWMKPINPWLPMSHSVTGFKTVISSGDYSTMWHQFDLLLVYGIVFVLITLAYFLLRTPKSTDMNQEEIVTPLA
ncbi:YhgE/Pip domain-containing protein [Paenibacillus zeisoli]|uniref:YhgE/Pip domain-containing protein n=1 Tax=Paenibacillus zeisoli TaxID=2496267 RepID=A0A3S1DWM7_9BACL|nr:YhgE/Pip domain-containing protein [Paenibacillus zeisoli]RUT30600.1 YhgE/Pip domain-containing protein [Paenibacillus zeisoli]